MARAGTVTRSWATLALVVVSAGYDHSGRPRIWANRQRWRLEDRLGDGLTEIEAHAQRQGDWEAATARARLGVNQTAVLNELCEHGIPTRDSYVYLRTKAGDAR